jgi:hypothetical protein
MYVQELSEDGPMMILAALNACGGWIAALAILVVGFVTVRSVHAQSGYLVGGGGALLLLSYCCSTFPQLAYRFGMFDMVSIVPILGMFVWIVSMGLVLAGAVVLARHVSARNAESKVGAA